MAERFEGKNLEEALNAAAQTFGVERYQLTYHVLLEKRGFLGGMKRVVIVRLYGRDARRLIDGHGELIDALQVLANKALVGRRLDKDIELDCQEFKGKRVEELEQQARQVADQVRRDRREQLLPAMTPIERRIV